MLNSGMAKRLKVKAESAKEASRSLTLLLLSDDAVLANLVLGVIERPWKLVRHGADGFMTHMFAQPNVRLVILDDQALGEKDIGWLLAQIRKHFSGISLLYIAGSHSDGNEKRARTNGAHYYVSKPLAHEPFVHVLQSFLQASKSKSVWP
jgi:DNA-binding response OmpR family regulator